MNKEAAIKAAMDMPIVSLSAQKRGVSLREEAERCVALAPRGVLASDDPAVIAEAIKQAAT